MRNSKAPDMNVERYLKRIGYKGARDPTIDVLRRLHRRHMLSVPFENLDIYLGQPIVLDQRAFYRKIVEARRGGYCYELNGCFAWLLKKLGYRVSIASARVAGKRGRFSPEFDHLTLLVKLEERWLVDVGFGDSFTTPKLVDATGVQEDDGFEYRITENSTGKLVSRKSLKSRFWKPQYAFTIKPRRLSEFVARNRYQQTSPLSHFTKGRLISQLSRTGRVTLTERKLVLTRNGKREERSVKSDVDFDNLLAKYFRLGPFTEGSTCCWRRSALGRRLRR